MKLTLSSVCLILSTSARVAWSSCATEASLLTSICQVWACCDQIHVALMGMVLCSVRKVRLRMHAR